MKKDLLGLSKAQLTTTLDGMSKADITEEYKELVEKARRGAVSAGWVAGGAASGLAFGEVLNLIFRAWGGSDMVLSSTIRAAYPYLRVFPAAVLGLLGLLAGSRYSSGAEAFIFGAGAGSLAPAVARLVDFLGHKADLSAEEEDVLRAANEALQKENAALREKVK